MTGANGLLGQAIISLFTRETDYELITSSVEDKPFLEYGHKYEKLDITNKEEVKKLIGYYEPNVIINCAAFTEVDKCETERELCWRLNVDGVKNIIIASKKCDAKIIHFSTDYIFDGKNGPYTEDATPNPLSFYGRSKLASENALISSGIEHVIIRTMVLYGIGNSIKKNFALWLVETLKKKQPVTIVTDQIGNSTIADDLAYGTYKIIEKNRTGIYNIAGKDILSRYDFALKLCEVFGFDKKLVSPILTSDLSQPAPRPLNSGLIVLKAEADLGIKLMDSLESLRLLKIQLGV
ncbi:MAG: dTDP-4-dehydrorhamnose reductase [Ignavibacteriae bacterium]|nr:dTDP-4-dehydrorhamnose reductase [Ignavibacteriota bacterium]MCB9242106.1 dTDP-4-dehydrorhamnose reductase [Ignavibacteriales bacterium]